MSHQQATRLRQSRTLLSRLLSAIEPERVHDALNRNWLWAANRDLRVTDVQVHRVFPRGPDRFIVKYQITLAGSGDERQMLLFGELIDSDTAALRDKLVSKLRKSRRKQVDRNDDTDALQVLKEPDMLLRVPGLDDKLPGLILLHQPKRAKTWFRQYYRGSKNVSSKHPPELTILNHRPGKRCVLLARTEDGNGGTAAMVIRCLKEGHQRHLENFSQIALLREHGFGNDAEDGIRIPAALGYDEELSAVTIEYVSGEVLGKTSSLSGCCQAEIAARAIAKLHAIPLQIEARYHVSDELAMLRDWVALTAVLRPELAVGLKQALRQVQAQFDALAAVPMTIVHRDYYCKQLLHDGKKTFLIDFDTLCIADPAIDIANYLAHERLADIAGADNAVSDDEFLAAYSQHLPLPARVSQVAWQNAALLRLACLYANHTGWQHIPKRLLDSFQVSKS